jgi:hypothetical protein
MGKISFVPIFRFLFYKMLNFLCAVFTFQKSHFHVLKTKADKKISQNIENAYSNVFLVILYQSKST